MNLLMILQTTSRRNTLSTLVQDYPGAEIFKGFFIPDREYSRGDILIIYDADKMSQKSLLSFLKKQCNNQIFLIVRDMQRLSPNIKNMAHL